MTDVSQGRHVRRRRNVKISPSSQALADIVQVRGKRNLRIQHLNNKDRDEQTQKELQVYLKYENGTVVHNAKNGNSITENNHTDDAVELLPDPTAPLEKGDNSNIATTIPTKSNNSVNARSVSENEGTYMHDHIPDSRTSVSRDSVISAGEKSTATASFVKVSMETGGPGSVNKDRGFMSEITETDESATSRSKKSNHPGPRSTVDFKAQSVHKWEADVTKSSAPQQEEVLFFIHGVGGSSDIWKPQLDYFSSIGYEIICPDLVGHGLSYAPDDRNAYHFQEILADLQIIFDKYCKKRNVIIGHSYGCAFATVIARQRSRRVTKLVLVAGGGPIPLAPQTGVFSLPMCMLSCIKPCVSCFFKRGAFHSASSKSQVNKDAAFDIPTYVLSHVMNGQWWLDGDELYHNWLHVPTLLIWGRHDKLVDLTEEEAMLEAIYGSTLEIIETAGHMVMMEAPAEFNRLLHDFISKKSFSPFASPKETGRSVKQEEEEDATQNPLTPRWFSPRKTPRSSIRKMSATSLHSLKSTRSRKSVPKGVLTHSIL